MVGAGDDITCKGNLFPSVYHDNTFTLIPVRVQHKDHFVHVV